MGVVPKLGNHLKTVPLTTVLQVFMVLAHIWQELHHDAKFSQHVVFEAIVMHLDPPSLADHSSLHLWSICHWWGYLGTELRQKFEFIK